MKSSDSRIRYAYFLVPIVIWTIYTGIIAGKPRTFPNKFNYFKELSISFMQGRMDIDHPGITDLVIFKDKKYLYWPPAPALVYMPFAAIWRLKTPDTFIVGCFGALNVFLLMVLVNSFSKRYDLNLNLKGVVFLGIFWGLGTVHFYMSMVGSVWYVSQIMAQTFLLLSIICMLADTSLLTLFLSGLFYSMAVYSKNDLLFAIFLIGAIYITKDKTTSKRALVKKSVIFLIPFVVFSLTNLAYNWVRFKDIFDNGTRYHQMNSRFIADFLKYGYLSFHFVPDNFVREVIWPPPFTKTFPFFTLDEEGFGFLWASPVFIFIFAAAFYFIKGFMKHFLKRPVNCALSYNDVIVMSAAVLSGALISLVVFMVMGTGWSQFGSRYSLDYQLMVLLFGLFIVKIWNKSRIFKVVSIILLCISVHLNYFGMKFYLQKNEPYYYQEYGNSQTESNFTKPSAGAFPCRAGNS